MVEDLTITETGSGGDLVLQGNNLSTTTSLWNMPYIALFGGNVQQLTPTDRPEGEQQFDWWGNSALIPNDTELQYNSRTEKALNETSLNSAGRIKIQQAAQKDLEFMSSLADVTVTVTLTGVDRVKIEVQLIELETESSNLVSFLWDGTKAEVVEQKQVGNVTPPLVWILTDGIWEDRGFWQDNENWID